MPGTATAGRLSFFPFAYSSAATGHATNTGIPLFQAFSPISVQGSTYCDCIKDGMKIDPACGSGSLLLKAKSVLGDKGVQKGYYGQEINITTYNLCRINMFLHNINYTKFSIANGDTLTDPKHWDDEPFELIVSNPPYSIKWVGDDGDEYRLSEWDYPKIEHANDIIIKGNRIKFVIKAKGKDKYIDHLIF